MEATAVAAAAIAASNSTADWTRCDDENKHAKRSLRYADHSLSTTRLNRGCVSIEVASQKTHILPFGKNEQTTKLDTLLSKGCETRFV